VCSRISLKIVRIAEIFWWAKISQALGNYKGRAGDFELKYLAALAFNELPIWQSVF